MQLPASLLSSLQGIPGFDKEAFEQAHRSGEPVTSVRVNPLKWSIEQLASYDPLAAAAPVPWSRLGYYLEERPSFTFDPLFHAGCYYVQEASSMFLEQAFLHTAGGKGPLKVLDLCAAPGGKSTHLQSLIPEEGLLVSNEVIKSRATVLKDNMIRWGSDNVVVTNNDPRDFARLPGYFDVMVVDAPCSGSGLFRRDEEAVAEWSENNVILCSQRQQRILADAWPALRTNGILIYSTCSYSREEDEAILDWITTELEAEPVRLPLAGDWNIIPVETRTHAWGYRFWPDRLRGEGFFMACFRKTAGADNFSASMSRRLPPAGKKQGQAVSGWIREEGYSCAVHNNIVYAYRGSLADEISRLLPALRILYSGVVVGELFNEQLVPAHSLAMSALLKESIPALELDRQEAIRYLQKKELDRHNLDKGWHRTTYLGHNLGWVKVLSNRINNYYPKELRILKDNP
ncbi:MAG: hypothetical protein QM755_01755 [Luteolibacter sp.]